MPRAASAAPRAGSATSPAVTTSAAPKPCRTRAATWRRGASPASTPRRRALSTPRCVRRRPTAGSGRRRRWQPGSSSAPALRSTPVRRGEPCAGSASPYRCRARATAARLRPTSRPPSKKLGDTLAQVRHEHPTEAVELWTQDEARLGLKPVTRRIWAPKGERPVAHARPGYEWLWLFAAVHPASGRVFRLVLPYLNAQLMQRFQM